MEFTATKRSKKRKKRWNVGKRRHEQTKFEVKTVKRRRFIRERNITSCKQKLIGNSMQADAFWKNYSAAQEWQKRHNVTWWRSRCIALEQENEILKNKIRSLISDHSHGNSSTIPDHLQDEPEENTIDANEEGELEFHVDKEMMNFLEQSIRHKMELKQKREEAASKAEIIDASEGGAAWVHARNEQAKFLYGDASSTILAMETALQATVDTYKDKYRPQYWPNIPFRP